MIIHTGHHFLLALDDTIEGAALTGGRPIAHYTGEIGAFQFGLPVEPRHVLLLACARGEYLSESGGDCIEEFDVAPVVLSVDPYHWNIRFGLLDHPDDEEPGHIGSVSRISSDKMGCQHEIGLSGHQGTHGELMVLVPVFDYVLVRVDEMRYGCLLGRGDVVLHLACCNGEWRR